MTLSQLRTFTAVARSGSLTAAARELGVSVPAVSAALAALRKELGDELVVRAGAGVALTPGGVRVAAAAAEIVGIADQARRSVREAREGASVLRLAATHEIGEYVTGPLVDAFLRTRPGLEVAVRTVDSSELEALLRDRRADVALGPRLVGPGLESSPFLRLRTIVVAPAGHALAGRASIRPSALRHEPWLAGPAGTDEGTSLTAVARLLGVSPDRVRAFPTHAGAIAEIEAGHGIGPALSYVVAEEVRRGALARLEVAGTPLETLWQFSSLSADKRVAAASMLRRFIADPIATRAILSRSPGATAARFRPPVHVTIWS